MDIDNLITGGATTNRRAKRSRKDGNSSSSSNTKNSNDDDLLALTLGSSTSGIRDADQYEESVLRNAELSNTPRLMVAKANNNNDNDPVVSFGFPSLAGLAPSRNVYADLGTVQNVLGKLRKNNNNNSKQKKSTRLLTQTRDCLKEQMLLALMQSASGDFEMGVFPQQEAKQEWKRRKLHRSKSKDQENHDTNTASSSSNQQQQQQQTNPRQQQQQQPSLALENNHSDQENNTIDDETPEGRLEGIKKGGNTKKKSVRFSATAKDDRPKTSLLSKKVLKLKPRPGRRRRVSNQERRRRQQQGGADEDEDEQHASEQQDEISRDEVVQQLKQLRLEREARRKKRNKAWRGHKNDNSGSDTNEIENESESEEEEFEFTGTEGEEASGIESQAQPEITNTILPDEVASSELLQNIKVEEAVADRNTIESFVENIKVEDDVADRDTIESSIVCPLCGEEITVPEMTAIKTEDGSSEAETANDKSHRDAILAQHMSICQTQRRSGRRKRGNTPSLTAGISRSIPSRRERTRRLRPNYAESDEENEFNPAGNQEMRNDDGNSSDDDYMANGVIQEDNDEDEFMDDGMMDMDEDDKEIATGKPAKSKSRARRSSRAKSHPSSRRAHPSTKSRPLPLDDWYEEDYEDRVDDWIEHGLGRMTMMNERDADEIPPGEEEYDGGLIIPAWNNDRLFPYQRTGLQWMWELHRQQCGGILGDEMVRGMQLFPITIQKHSLVLLQNQIC